MEYKNPITNFFMKHLYPKADGFIFQTDEAKDCLKDVITCESVVIPNPVNEVFLNKKISKKRNHDIVTVGRLESPKNQKLLIDSFNLIKDTYQDYNLRIYGPGSLKETLEKQIDTLQLNDRVFLMGNSDDVARDIIDACMFVLSSDYEGMPNALMEAMALGLPCISTDCPCGGPKYLIQNNENGVLVPVNDAEKMAEAMRKILNDSAFAKKIGENAKTSIEKIRPEKVCAMWEEYILKNMKEI